MKKLTIEDLKALTGNDHDICISIHIPTVKGGSETRQNSVKYKNNIKKAERLLKEGGQKAQDTEVLLRPAMKLIDDTKFWQNQQLGFCSFISRNFFQHYTVPLDLPEFVSVGRHFYVRPLNHLFTGNGEYYLLSLNLNDIKLYSCNRFSIEEMDLGDFPTSIKDAYAGVEFEKQISFHTETPRRAGKRDAHFFGRGSVGDEDTKDIVYKYIADVSGALDAVIDRRDNPLVLGGVDYLVGAFRDKNSYPYLLDEWISGSPEGMKREKLHTASWDIVSPVFQKQITDSLQILNDKTGTEYTSGNIEEIVRAAVNKRVDSLFFDPKHTIWGRFNSGTQEVHRDENDTVDNDELINYAYIHTLKNNGTAFSIDRQMMPGDTPVAAIFRY